MRGHRRVACGIASAVLGLTAAACTFPSQIKTDAVDYNAVVEETTDRLLVLNILRSRDKAPLHFAAIPLIHESLQAAGSVQATLPFGPINHATVRDTASGSLAVQVAPSFDLSTLDTKDFITGLSSPIDPRLVKYALDRGFDRRLILMLFFSSAEIIERKDIEPNIAQRADQAGGPITNDKIQVFNSPRDAIDGTRPILHSDVPLSCDERTQFELYLDFINRLQRFTANSYSERRLVAEGFDVKTARDVRDLAAIDPSKYRLVYDTSRGKSGNKGVNPSEAGTGTAHRTSQDRIYRLYAISPDQKVAFCYGDEGNGTAIARVNGAPGLNEAGKVDRCTQPTVDVSGGEDVSSVLPERMLQPREGGEAPSAATKPEIVPGHDLQTGAAAPALVHQNGPASPYCQIFDRFWTAPTDPRWQLRLNIRSVGEMIAFLGDLLYYQERLPSRLYLNQAGHAPNGDRNHNNPVTLGYCDQKEFRDGEWRPRAGSNCEAYEGGALFRLDGAADTARFSVDYLDHKSYSVEPYSTADRSLLVLSILNQLINLNKSASDIKTTPFVQVQP